MNTFVKAIVLSLSTALVAAPAMAAPQDHAGFNDRNTDPKLHQKPHQNPHLNQYQSNDRNGVGNAHNRATQPPVNTPHKVASVKQFDAQAKQQNHPAYKASNAPKAYKHQVPSRDWKVGQKVPAQFQGKGYQVDHRHFKKLTKPAKNQQWIKVNNDYVLTHAFSHVILKIVKA